MRDETKRNALWITTFIILTASLAVPFFVVHEPPLLDYPNHLARAFVLSHIHDPAFTLFSSTTRRTGSPTLTSSGMPWWLHCSSFCQSKRQGSFC